MRGIASYKRSRNKTVPQERVLVLLLETAEVKLLQAADLQAQGRKASKELAHARSILFELMAALDPEPNAELVGQLQNLYAWSIQELVAVNREPDADRVRGVLRVISELREAFSHAADAA